MADNPEHGKRKTPAQHKKLANLLAEEVPIGQALVQAGWSETQAKKGWGAVPDRVIATLPKKMKRLITKGKMDKRDLEHLAIGRLAENVTSGKDGGAMSAKILGSHREINAWTPDQQLGVIVLQTPTAFADPERRKQLLEGED